MLTSSNEWHLTNCFNGCLSDVYYTDGDTIINNQPHKILNGYHYISRTFLLRENTSERKVFLSKIGNHGTVDEFLLYNFSVQVGDSIQMLNPITPFPENAGYFKLDSINSNLLADGNSYRHFYFTPTESNDITDYNVTWIEGVGSLSMITAPGGNGDINGAGKLSCLFKDNNLVYENLDSISGCQSVLKNREVSLTHKKPTLYYKRKTKSYYLNDAEQVKRVQFYDGNGKLLHEQKNNKSQFTLQLKTPYNFPNIVVVVAVLRNGKKYSYKIIQY